MESRRGLRIRSYTLQQHTAAVAAAPAAAYYSSLTLFFRFLSILLISCCVATAAPPFDSSNPSGTLSSSSSSSAAAAAAAAAPSPSPPAAAAASLSYKTPLGPGPVCRHVFFPEVDPLEELLDEGPPTSGLLLAGRGAAVSHASYEVLSDRFVKEYGFRVVEYKHRSGLIVWSISTPPSEEEMSFSICFRTPVKDSLGTPHVLEHAVLNGSESFPIYSLFFKIGGVSLNSYLNASTWPERTCYPFASLNLKDFHNLMHLYLDAVFRPLAIKPNTHHLKQEGWRYEAVPKASASTTGSGSSPSESGSSPSGSGSSPSGSGSSPSEVDCKVYPEACELKYAGIVFSEMKGVFSSPELLEEQRRFQELFPDVSTYREVAGGDPEAIPQLTIPHLADFHKKYYAPSNAWVVLYGPDPVQERLSLIDDYLTRHGLGAYKPPPVVIEEQVAFPAPVYAEHRYASSASELKDWVTISWVLNPREAVASACKLFGEEERLLFRILHSLLTGTKTSPLYKALADSNLGGPVHAPGLDLDPKQAVYTVGLKEVPQREGAAAAVERVVMETLEQIVDKGFTPLQLAAALNKTEFSLRECPRKSLPRGLVFTRQMSQEITFGKDAMNALRFEDTLWRLRQRLAAGEKVFEKLIKKHLLQNTHRLTLRLKASREVAEETAEKERRALAAAAQQMGLEGIAAVAREQEELKLLQTNPASPEALASLPSLQREDIKPEGEEIGASLSPLLGSVPLVTHELPSSSLVYVQVALSLSDLSLADIFYLPLLARMMVETGTRELSPDVMLPLVDKTAGGVSASAVFTPRPDKPFTVPYPYAARGFLFVSGKATRRKAHHLWCLLHAMITEADLSNWRLGLQIIKQLIDERQKSFSDRPFLAARRHSRASFSLASFMETLTEGYPNLVFLRELLKRAESDWGPVHARLQSLRHRLLRRENLLINVTGDSESLFDALEGHGRAALLDFIQSVPEGRPYTLTGGDTREVLLTRRSDRQPKWADEAEQQQLLQQQSRSTAFLLPAQVSDLSLSLPLSPPGSPYLGSDAVGVSRVDLLFILKQVREVGGAYGGWARYTADGLLSFLSYRDPKAAETLEVFKSAAAFAESWVESIADEEEERALLEAVLPVISLLDFPVSVEAKGLKSLEQLLNAEQPIHRSRYRHQILSTSRQDLREFAAKMEECLAAAPQALVLIGPPAAAAAAADKGEELQHITVN